ncbi:MAG: hypothetical protein ACOCQD_00095 [archaeon]
MALKKVENTEKENTGYPSTSDVSSEVNNSPVRNNNSSNSGNYNNGGFDEEKLSKLVAKAVREANSSREEEDELGVLPQGAKEFVQAAQGVEKVKSMFKSQYEQTIEDTVGQVMAQAVQQSLGTMMGAGQQQQSEPAQPQMGFWKQAGLMFMQNVSQEIPQYLPSILDTLKDVVGKERVQKGYDAGINYLETHQEMKNIPNIVMQMDAEDMEDVKEYAKMMGITNTSMAKQFLLEHQESLRQEYSEYQSLQNGEYQRDNDYEYSEYTEYPESDDIQETEVEETKQETKTKPTKRYLKKSEFISQDEIKEMYDNGTLKIDNEHNVHIPEYDKKIETSNQETVSSVEEPAKSDKQTVKSNEKVENSSNEKEQSVKSVKPVKRRKNIKKLKPVE